MCRREFVTASAAIPARADTALARPLALLPTTPVLERVGSDQDRFGETRQLPAGNPMWFKVAAADSVNSLFMMEKTNIKRGGGPPKHLHAGQDGWFYAINGPYVAEVGERRFQLNSCDSVLALRGIPHAFAFAGEGVG